MRVMKLPTVPVWAARMNPGPMNRAVKSFGDRPRLRASPQVIGWRSRVAWVIGVPVAELTVAP